MNELDLINSILTKEEKAQIKSFVQNDHMKQAVKKALLVQLYYDGKLTEEDRVPNSKNWVFNYLGNSDENLGKAVRSVCNGVISLEAGFNRLENLQEPESTIIQKTNEAR